MLIPMHMVIKITTECAGGAPAPFRDIKHRTPTFGVQPLMTVLQEPNIQAERRQGNFMTNRDPKIRISFLKIDANLLAERMRGINNAICAFLFTDLHHLLPRHVHARTRYNAIDNDNGFIRGRVGGYAG
jgi:hypothetical protein